MQNLRHSTFRLSPNLYCNKFVFLKVYKISAKRVQRKYVSWHWRVMQNLKKKKQKTKKKQISCFKNEKKLVNLIRAFKSQKNFHFDWSLSCKVYNVWFKNLQKSYLSKQWRVMQNLKKHLLVSWKMTWEIWQIFTWTLGSVIIVTLMGSSCPK